MAVAPLLVGGGFVGVYAVFLGQQGVQFGAQEFVQL